jgi:hypothetical protein
MIERRETRRNLCSDIVELFWSDRLGWPHRAKAVLEDISQTGACVQTEDPIPLGAELALRLGELGLPGRIRYCTLIGGSYFVGIQFLDGMRWAPEDYNPACILNWPESAGTPPLATIGDDCNLHIPGQPDHLLNQVPAERRQERLLLRPTEKDLGDTVQTGKVH